MRSIILCEGKDDAWFIAYYLNKVIGWTEDKKTKSTWPKYRYKAKDSRQQVVYMTSNANVPFGESEYVAIYAVGGQDRLKNELDGVLRNNRLFREDLIETVVVVRDCDAREQDDVVQSMGVWFPETIELRNHLLCPYTEIIEDRSITINIMPLVIPFDDHGAIETVLLNALGERGPEECYIVAAAKHYVETLSSSGHLTSYLKRGRQRTKAEYSAAIAITNPDHSTALFQDMVMACNWEKSCAVQNHYGRIAEVISMNKSENCMLQFH